MKASRRSLPAGRQTKISVIMSVYNGMPHLQEAVESILNQTYKDFEFIIVDDGSNDGTWRYLISLKARRIKLIKNKKNLGLAASLNIALWQAHGDLIARMDADDISLPERFERQIEFLLKNPSIDLCGTWADLIDENGIVVGEKKYPISDNLMKKALAWYSPIIHPTLIAKAKFFRELKGYDPRFDMAEEYELLMRAKNKYKMANIPRKLLLWRLWDRRRSREQMSKLDRVDLLIKLEAFKRGDYGFLYLVTIAKKFLMTYLIPSHLKIGLAKILKLA